MAATALIKVTQGPNTDLGGIAVLGTLWDGTVVITNDDNTDVVAWEIYLLDVPPGSALTPGLLASASSSTPMASFDPDVEGSYRTELIVTGSGGTTNTDIRVFGIPYSTGRHLLAPPYQKLPDPLPLLGSGLPGEKPDEMNFGGQTRGWMGDDDPSRRLLHQLIDEVNDLVDVPDYSAASDSDVLAVEEFSYLEPVAVTGSSASSGWVVNSNFSTAGIPGYYPGLINFLPFTDEGIQGVSTTDNDELLADADFDGTYVWLVGASLSTLDGHIRRVTLSTPPVFSVKYALDAGSGNPAIAIVYGSSYLWVAGDGDVWRVDPSSPGGSYTNAATGTDYNDIVHDDDSTHYGDTNKRVWTCSRASASVYRIELATPAVDHTLPITNIESSALAVGADYIWAAGNNNVTGAATLCRIVPDPVSLSTQSTSIDAVTPNSAVLDVVYEDTTGKLFVYLSQNTTGYPLLLRVHPTTLVVEDSVVLSSYAADSGGPPPRLFANGGYVWVPVMGPAGGAAVFRVKASDFTTITNVNNPRDLVWGTGSATLVGDVTGPATSNTVEKIQGTDVNPVAPTSGQCLWYNSGTSRWEGAAPRAHDIGSAEEVVDSTPYVGAATTRVFRVETSAGPITLNLAAPVGAGGGFFVTVIDVDGDASSSPVTVVPPGGNTINGSSSATIARDYGSITLYKSASSNDWSII